MTLKQKPAPTLNELVEYISEKLGTPISVASVQKDIYAMRYDEGLGYFAPIEYSKEKRGYVYTDPTYSIQQIPVSEEDLQGLEMAIGILQQFAEIPAIRQFGDVIQKLAASVKMSRGTQQGKKVLLLDRPRKYQGTEFMQDLVEAIQERYIVRLKYRPFTQSDERKHTIHPFFIKEYNGRMYLIARDIHPVKESKLLTFAFDRIADITVTMQHFAEELPDQESYFGNSIGISLPGTPVENVVLSFRPGQASYLKSQPLHHSQKIIKDHSTEFIIELQLVLNYELKSLILGFGRDVRVLKPDILALEIRNNLIEAAGQYPMGKEIP
ncbi:MAG TPA: WYL domain-containing protein [Chitinophagaceae bacterium]|nr:WYL domain-containing protein [Chitinophagaceae bacterium]